MNQLEALRCLIQLLQDAKFKAGAFDAQTRFKFNHDRVIKAGRLLFEKPVPLTGLHDPADQQIKKEENTKRGAK